MKIKVMLIDHDKEFLKEMEETLVLSGYDVVSINDPVKALGTVIEEEPDVVLLDLKMPQKSGFEVANELKYTFGTCRVPIIVMTAYFKEELMPLLSMCGVRKYLKKPLYPLEVIAQIESVVGKS